MVEEIGLPLEAQEHGSVNCPGCGRFAKWAGGYHYYDGNYDNYVFSTNCKKCGILTTECV